MKIWLTQGLILISISLFSQQRNLILAKELAKEEGVVYDLNNESRKEFRRTPGPRAGILYENLTNNQKAIIHELIAESMGSLGYHKITAMMFNEDLPKKTEPGLGSQQYWVAIYGNPEEQSNWAFRLEGHHLSLNLTFHGNVLMSCSPFLFGAWPAQIEEGYRYGFRNLFWEEMWAIRLIGRIGAGSGYEGPTIPNPLPGEAREINFEETGTELAKMDEDAKELLIKLSNEYFSFFQRNYVDKVIGDINKLRFNWWGDLKHRYAYRIYNESVIIEFQNIGNHIHCLIRFPHQEQL